MQGAIRILLFRAALCCAAAPAGGAQMGEEAFFETTVYARGQDG